MEFNIYITYFVGGGKCDIELTNALIAMACKNNSPYSLIERGGGVNTFHQSRSAII